MPTDAFARDDQCSDLNEIVFKDGIVGKSILDISSLPGYFCDEALKRGARLATIIEPSPERVARIHKTPASGYPSPIYICANFDEWRGEENSYDVVVCFNALHHFYDPVGALRKMMRIARERIVLEIATITPKDIFRSWRNWSLLCALRAPLVLLNGKHKSIDTAADRTFLFTKFAITKIFNEHTLAFEPLKFKRSSRQGYFIVEARRRQIDHLVVVAGVACVGKTRFMDTLNSSDALRARFGIEKGFEQINAFKTPELPARLFKTLLFHYDILRPQGRYLQRHDRDPAFQIVSCAKKITVITLAQSQEIIVDRSINNDAPSKRRTQLAKYYNDDGFLQIWYDVWLDTLKSVLRPMDIHHIVLASGDYPALTTNELHELLK